MHSITFMYRVGQNPKVFYGKVIDYISDDHDGLDIDMMYYLRNGLAKFDINPRKLHVSIIGYTPDNFFSYYSKQDRSCFDFYADLCDPKQKYYYLRRGNKKIVKYI